MSVSVSDFQSQSKEIKRFNLTFVFYYHVFIYITNSLWLRTVLMINFVIKNCIDSNWYISIKDKNEKVINFQGGCSVRKFQMEM